MTKDQIYNLRQALDAYKESSYLEYTNIPEGLFSYNTTPEDFFLRKEAWSNLTKDSKLILQLIHYTPSEILEGFIGKNGEIYMRKLVNYIRSHFTRKRVDIERTLLSLKEVM